LAAVSVRTESGRGWAVVRLSASSDLNVLGKDTLLRLRDELVSVLAGDCRCLAVVGEGRSFAVGADLREIGSLGPYQAGEFSDLGNGILRLLENSQTVIIAGIDGLCIGGGLDLALSADWRLATSRSVFAHPGAGLGIITGFGGTQRLPRLIGRHRAARWLFTGERIDAVKAYKDGFLQEICPDESFEEALFERVKRFASMSAGRIGHIRHCLRYGDEGWTESW